MRKLFYLCFICCLCSCDVAEQERQSRNATDNEFNYVKEFTYKEHEYIKFSANRSCGVVHNPECKKCKEHEQ